MHEQPPGCVLIMTTDDAVRVPALDCMKRGAAAYLHKPFEPAYLIELLERARRERTLLRVEDLLNLRTRELDENRRNLAALIEGSPESVILIEADGRVVTCNTVTAARLGRRPEDLQGRSIYDFLSPTVAAERKLQVDTVVAEGRPVRFEDVRDGRGNVSRVAICGDDVTAHRDAERRLAKQNELPAAVRRGQDLFISGHDPKGVYQEMLHILVRETGSAYGFLDEVLRDADGTPYELSLAMSDISWDEASRRLYEELVGRRLEFRNLDNLAGAPVLKERTIIANDAPTHARYRGIPPGHPPLLTYLGVPLVYGSEVIGVAGVANRPGGSMEEIAEMIKPLTQTCAAMIWAGRAARRERQSILALRTSEERHRRIAETANEGIWSMDAGHLTTFVNKRMGETPAGPMEAFVFAEDLDDHAEKMIERRFRHRDGSEVWRQAVLKVRVLYIRLSPFNGLLRDVHRHHRTQADGRAAEQEPRDARRG